MNIKPIAWMYTDRWGTHFTEDENEILDGVGIESWTPLLAEHDVIKRQAIDGREDNERLLLQRNKWEYRYGQCMGVIIVLTAAHLVVWTMLSP